MMNQLFEIKLGNETELVWIQLPPRLADPSGEHEGWNSITFRVSAGAWDGKKYLGSLQTDEVLPFLKESAVLLKTLSGTAKLNSIESWLNLDMSITQLGQIVISGTAQNSHQGSILNFNISTDQSYFVGLADKIEMYLENQRYS